jgi:hypothetical protein
MRRLVTLLIILLTCFSLAPASLGASNPLLSTVTSDGISGGHFRNADVRHRRCRAEASELCLR